MLFGRNTAALLCAFLPDVLLIYPAASGVANFDKFQERILQQAGPMRGGSSRYIVRGPESQGGAHDSS